MVPLRMADPLTAARSLVKRLEAKPFTLIGVNSDRDKADCKTKNEKQQITWRSFWNGPMGTGGPISKQFNVRGWPTMYLIDAKGVIRNKWLGNPGDKVLDDNIDKLIAEGKLHAFPEFAQSFKLFLEHHGHRELYIDYYVPTWVDCPWVVLDLLKAIPADAANPADLANEGRRRFSETELPGDAAVFD